MGIRQFGLQNFEQRWLQRWELVLAPELVPQDCEHLFDLERRRRELLKGKVGLLVLRPASLSERPRRGNGLGDFVSLCFSVPGVLCIGGFLRVVLCVEESYVIEYLLSLDITLLLVSML